MAAKRTKPVVEPVAPVEEIETIVPATPEVESVEVTADVDAEAVVVEASVDAEPEAPEVAPVEAPLRRTKSCAPSSPPCDLKHPLHCGKPKSCEAGS